MKQSRLLTKLDTAIAGMGDSVSLHCLRIERACFLARLGRVEDARATVVELRRLYEPCPNVLISSWLSLAEGLLIHFSDMGQQSRDKVHRAFALSEAAGLTQLNALSAAWLAHMDYLTGNMNGMARFAQRALQLAEKNNHSALSRANLVIALAHHLAGHLDQAKAWYGRAHSHATAEGDDATISALMHNMAWLRAANLRQATLSGRQVPHSGEHALTGIESTVQFDSFVGSVSLHTLSPILRAQILTVKGRFADALATYEAYLAASIQQGMTRMHASLLADQAWCRVNLGQLEQARCDARNAETFLDPQGHFDDRASAHSRLAQVFAAVGDTRTSSHHDELAKASWEGHERLQQHITEVLRDIKAP